MDCDPHGFKAGRLGIAAALLTLIVSTPAAAREVVSFASAFAPGTIVVHTSERSLYLILDQGFALHYDVGVGRADWQWVGTTYIDGMYIRPNWVPPAAIRREQPDLPLLIAGGSPLNPMGEAAMTLAGGDYAIHGTNAAASIGGFVSYGCIRMYNEDVVDLFGRVGIGTAVIVMP